MSRLPSELRGGLRGCNGGSLLRPGVGEGSGIGATAGSWGSVGRFGCGGGDGDGIEGSLRLVGRHTGSSFAHTADVLSVLFLQQYSKNAMTIQSTHATSRLSPTINFQLYSSYASFFLSSSSAKTPAVNNPAKLTP